VVAPDHDRRLHAPGSHEIVEGAAGLRALTVPEPADAGGKSLEGDALSRKRDPAPERRVLREEVEDRAVRLRDVGGIARERGPPERPLPFAEERPDVERDEADDRERVGDAGLNRPRAEVVAVVERHGAAPLEREHRADVRAHRGDRAAAVRVGVRRPEAQGLLVRKAMRDVTVQLVVSGGLVREDVRDDPALEEALEKIDRVGTDADRNGLLCALRRERAVDRGVESVDPQVEIARREALVDARRIDFGD
jgi:hypothetical protein